MKIRDRKLPELLAPVGGPAQLAAAVNNGADAVYLGGSRFNARGRAENFTLPRLQAAIAYAHARDVRVYVTFNTLLKDRELPDALRYGADLYEAGADAVIVQDMGLAKVLREEVPGLPLHLSTQGTAYHPQAAGLLKEWGFRRIVPARELTLEEIRAFAAACHAPDAAGRICEVEVFVHGALCMCYSGQCQLSRVLGGGSARSGNRGLCAQPCRLPYTDDRGRTGYFLSPGDLCLLEDIPALCQAGVDSFKIEGRLKSPEYVAVVTGIYRKYLDQYARTGRVDLTEEDRQDLVQIYHRGGFTRGYLYGNPGRDLLSGDSPKNAGICVGRVRSLVQEKSAGRDRAAAAGAARKGAVLVDVAAEGTDPSLPASRIAADESAGTGERTRRGARKGSAMECAARMEKMASEMHWEGLLEEGDGVEFRPAPGGAAAGIRAEAAGSLKAPAPGGAAAGIRAEAAGSPKAPAPGKAAAGDSAGGVITFRRILSGRILRIGDMKGEIRPGDLVYRVTQRTLLDRARETFAGGAAADPANPEDMAALDRRMIRHLPLKIEFRAAAGAPARLRLWEKGRDVICVFSSRPAEEALRRPLDPDRIRTQLARLGGTPFKAAPEDIRVELDGPCAIPIGEINRMRREGIQRLLQEKKETGRTPLDRVRIEAAANRLMALSLQLPDAAASIQQLGRPVPAEDFLEGGEGLPTIFPVTKGNLDAWLEAHFGELAAKAKKTGILIRGLGWIRRFQEAGVKVYGGFGLNVCNEAARQAFAEIGVEIIEASCEAGLPLDGRVPLMITEHPIQSKTLTDRKGQVHEIGRAPSGDKTIVW